MTETALPLPPPRHLKREGRDLWRSIVEDHDDLENHQLALLCLACEQADTQDQARKVIARDGMTITAKSGAIKPNPHLSIERQAARLLASFIRQLKLDPDQRPRERWVGRVKPHSARVHAQRAKRS